MLLLTLPRVHASVACFDEVGKTTESWSHVEGRMKKLLDCAKKCDCDCLLAAVNKSSWKEFIQSFKKTAM